MVSEHGFLNIPIFLCWIDKLSGVESCEGFSGKYVQASVSKGDMCQCSTCGNQSFKGHTCLYVGNSSACMSRHQKLKDCWSLVLNVLFRDKKRGS